MSPTGNASARRAVSVATPLPLDRLYDYAVPDGLETPPPGTYAVVEVGGSRAIGVVWGPGSPDAPATLKPLLEILDPPPMPETTRRFLERAADYTLTPLGGMVRLATRAPGLADPPPRRVALRRGPETPARLTEARARVLDAIEALGGAPAAPGELAREAGVSSAVVSGLVSAGALVREEVARDAPYPAPEPDAPGATLSEAQEAAAAQLRAGAASGAFGTTLLVGVTGSGKTEVYLEAVAETLRQGRQALVLAPEIALTSGFVERLSRRFGAPPGEWHSAVPPAERRRLWRAAASGEARVVIGARSALFLPFAALGLIVVDEEHDGAYKQEDGVLYHARDMAVLRASVEGARAVLVSATPSLESWANAEAGKYERIDLPERYGVAALPKLSAIDLRADGPPRGRWIAPPLARAVRERLEAGEQSLLFLNRRGYAPLTVCRGCGHFFECRDCDARLVEHRFRARLMCHQCGHEEPTPAACPQCGAADKLTASGPGVERLAEEAQALFPEARLALLSSDLAPGAAALRAQVAAIAAGEADVIVGTQIVAKGWNFPLLTLVGVIDADLGLQGGDLRAAERTFQLLRQVSGRAGRAERPGVALVQTSAPDHPVMRALLTGAEEAFMRREADVRRAAGAPPYGRYAAAILSGRDEARVWAAGRALAAAQTPLVEAGATLYGPAAAPVARIRGRARVRMLIKAPRGAALQPALRKWIAGAKPPSSVRLAIDVDPQSFL